MSKDVKIAVIGGGPSGISFARNLIEQHHNSGEIGKHMKVTIFDQFGRPGFGGPFGLGTKLFVCNQRSKTMGFSPNSPGAFYDWLSRQECAQNKPDAWMMHPPRHVFGQYLGYLHKTTVDLYSSTGHSLQYIPNEVVGIRENSFGVELKFADGRSDVFDVAILASGNLPSTAYSKLASSYCYLTSGYPISKSLAKVNPVSKVLVIGTSLSGIDFVNALFHFGHEAKVTMASRKGRIPGVLSLGFDYTPQHFTEQAIDDMIASPRGLKLEQVVALIKKEVAAAMGLEVSNLDWQSVIRSAEQAQTFLTNSMFAAQGPQPYQSVLRAIARLSEKVYQALSLEEKAKAIKSSEWKQFRHTMAIPTASRFQKLLNDDKVEVRSNLHDINPVGPHGFDVEFKSNDGSMHEIENFDVVVNSTGAGTDIRKIMKSGTAGPLLKSIIENGVARPFSVGGIEVVPNRWNVIDAKGIVSNRIYATGQLIKGSVFYCSGMDAIARLTYEMAESVLIDHVWKTDEDNAAIARRIA